MGLTAADGHPQQTGVLTPEIWSTKLLVKFYKATTYGAIANTDYETEVANYGDQVKIRTTPDITIHDYSKGQSLQTSRPQSNVVTLTIDKAKYWNFLVEDVDHFQSDIDYMEDWTQEAALKTEESVDSDVNADIFGSAHASNSGSNAGVISTNINLGATGAELLLNKGNVIDHMADMELVFNEQEVPEWDRWWVIPSWFTKLVRTSDAVNAEMLGDATSMIRGRRRIGELYGFTFYRSNQLSTAVDGGNTVTHSLAGQRKALSFASQFTQTQLLTTENHMGHKCRGLYVFGYDVLKAEALADDYVREG